MASIQVGNSVDETKTTISHNLFYSVNQLNESSNSQPTTGPNNFPLIHRNYYTNLSSMFDNIRSGYARLVPGGSNDQEDAEIMQDLGIYEDEETRAERAAAIGDNFDMNRYCPVWFVDWYDSLPTPTLRERLLGCGTMMLCGYLLSFGSFVRLTHLFRGNPVPIVVNVTVGNIITLCGTCFLTGPASQLEKMFKPSRKLASTFYLGSLGVTLILLMLPHFPFRGLLLFLLMIGQYLAITWYCLSYIPFARQFVKHNCLRLMGRQVDDDEY